MAIDFPASPTIGDTFVVGTVTYTWDGTKWTAIAGAATPDKIEEGNTSAEVIDTGSDGRFVVTTDGTEALRVDNQQRLGLGTSSPSQKLHIGGENPGDSIIRQDATTGGTNWEVGERSAGNYQWWEDDTDQVRMTLTSQGRLGIGTTSPTAQLEIGGNITLGTTRAAYLRYPSDSASPSRTAFEITAQESAAEKAVFKIDGRGSIVGNTFEGTVFRNSSASEIARFDTSGRLLVGTTDASQASGTGVKLLPGGQVWCVGSSGDVYSHYNGGYKFYVSGAGVVNATSGTITVISDQRFKENVRDLEDGLTQILALQPRKFDWKEGKGSGEKDERGFIAQEFEQVFPDLISEWKDAAPEGEEPYKAVRADLIPVLVKAIQEQQAMITELQTKVAALEAS